MQVRRRIWRARLALAALVTATTASCGGSSGSPEATLKSFMAAWNQADWASMAGQVDRPAPGFASIVPGLTTGLGATDATHTTGALTRHGTTATAPVSSTYQIPGIGPWRVDTSLTLAEHSGHWLVEWSPASVYPGLAAGERLALSYTWAPRAPILGAAGMALTSQTPVVVVGLEGSRIKSANAVSKVLEAAGASPSEVASALAAALAHPTFFEDVFAISAARYSQLGGATSALYEIPGTVFEHTSARAAVTPGLAAHLVGSVGPVTAQELRQLGPGYDATSSVGQTGLEEAYEKRLAGSPGAEITVVGPAGSTTRPAVTFAPKPGAAVDTSIDLTAQRAAEAAMGGVPGDAALVAVRASTGQILASVSQPAASQFDQALDGAYPPGSTFKVITATALIQKGLSPSSPASCPSSLTVDGEVFHNAEGDRPVATMAGAFTESCNTAFVQLATSHLQPASLPASAALYGIGSPPQMGLAAIGGSVPAPLDNAGLAATAIGQASVVVSPLDMAMAAAAIDTGSDRPARLVVGAPDDSSVARPLPAAVVSGLGGMMAQVVASGTAAGVGLPVGTHAKTGTAEYGSGASLHTDAWLIGYDGDVAFAVVVHDSAGNGGPVAGPIAARFLTALSPAIGG